MEFHSIHIIIDTTELRRKKFRSWYLKNKKTIYRSYILSEIKIHCI